MWIFRLFNDDSVRQHIILVMESSTGAETSATLTYLTPQVIDYLKEELRDQSCLYGNTMSFLKGLIFGQLSVIILIVLALRYLLMEDVRRVKKVMYNQALSFCNNSLLLLLSATFRLACRTHPRRARMQQQRRSNPRRTLLRRPITTWFTILQRAPTGSTCFWRRLSCSTVTTRISTIDSFWPSTKS